MKLQKNTQLALYSVLEFAARPGELVPAAEVADKYGESAHHLAKVLSELVRAGIVESVRGKGGGIRLARPPEAIQLGEVVRASEGDAPIVECLSGEPGACRIARSCRLKGILVESFGALYDAIDRYTLADLVDKPEPLHRALLRL